MFPYAIFENLLTARACALVALLFIKIRSRDARDNRRLEKSRETILQISPRRDVNNEETKMRAERVRLAALAIDRDPFDRNADDRKEEIATRRMRR